ncbi:OsmC family protein [Thermogemmatispora sp.]|uniref:OsmC family protein n=1 Tax=Thermogemmatispora sp. TaxID=1968838 RepID=UPI001DF7688B|nr:OsmC family protein [Thermogemmatispora sp.]MBX5450513.1 OsmC family protein [Thermogemmatispora sp.]
MALALAARLRLQEDMTFLAETSRGSLLQLAAAAEQGREAGELRPMELLPVALAACMGITVLSILRKKRLRITAYEVVVQSERTEHHPRVFTAFHLEHRIAGIALEQEVIERAIELSESKYCPVSAMLRPAALITNSVTLLSAAEPGENSAEAGS